MRKSPARFDSDRKRGPRTLKIGAITRLSLRESLKIDRGECNHVRYQKKVPATGRQRWCRVLRESSWRALCFRSILADCIFGFCIGHAYRYRFAADNGPLDRNLFGSFLEHLGRAIYEGIYDPGSPLSDANGFRKDVMEEVRNLGVPIIRYPGGNFVSGYNWLDGVGPKKDRPRELDKAWNTIDTNQFGTNEFMAWSKMVGTRPLMGLNLGTGTAERAAALVEYCNVEKGTKWSELRRSHGIDQPYKVEHWCLGNEMDGPWQIGHMTATEYGLKAQDAARQMHAVDPSLKLIACGSSGPAMPTYLEWDREVLEQCYDYVDALSLHRYIGNTQEETGKDSSKFVAMNLSMERQIAETLAVCDMVRGHKRSPKKLWLSFDEWNVWYRARDAEAMNGHEHEAPHLLEEVYNVEDALLVGGIVNSLMRNADRIKIACLAQLVNVIAPIATNEKGLLRQTIYYPYSWALQRASGSVLNALVESPTYEVSGLGQVPYLDVAATLTRTTRLHCSSSIVIWRKATRSNFNGRTSHREGC